MNQKLKPYYLSRTALSIVITALLYFTGSRLWAAVLIGGVILLLFLLAPLSGRYTVHPEFGVTALRRDDFTQAVNDRAARNGFVACMLLAGGASAYTSTFGNGMVPANGLMLIVLAGLLVYYISDFFLRRA